MSYPLGAGGSWPEGVQLNEVRLWFERVEDAPGAARTVTVTADPRLLARLDGKAGRWRMVAGPHRVALAKSAGDLELTAEAPLMARVYGN